MLTGYDDKENTARSPNVTSPERDLFGTIRLVRNWDRIGTNGQELVEVFATEIEAGEALEALARAKRRRGNRDL